MNQSPNQINEAYTSGMKLSTHSEESFDDPFMIRPPTQVDQKPSPTRPWLSLSFRRRVEGSSDGIQRVDNGFQMHSRKQDGKHKTGKYTSLDMHVTSPRRCESPIRALNDGEFLNRYDQSHKQLLAALSEAKRKGCALQMTSKTQFCRIVDSDFV